MVNIPTHMNSLSLQITEVINKTVRASSDIEVTGASLLCMTNKRNSY